MQRQEDVLLSPPHSIVVTFFMSTKGGGVLFRADSNAAASPFFS
jgi:hypothetical protein